MLVSTSRAGLTQQAWRPPPALSLLSLSLSASALPLPLPLPLSLAPSLTPPSPSPPFPYLPPSLLPSFVGTSSLFAFQAVDPTCQLPPRSPPSSRSNSAPSQSNQEQGGLASASLHSLLVCVGVLWAQQGGFWFCESLARRATSS